MLFAELTYTLATEEAERIGVDHVARMTATGTGENSTGKLSVCVGNWQIVNVLSYVRKNKNSGHKLITEDLDAAYINCLVNTFSKIYMFFCESLKSSIVCPLPCSC